MNLKCFVPHCCCGILFVFFVSAFPPLLSPSPAPSLLLCLNSGSAPFKDPAFAVSEGFSFGDRKETCEATSTVVKWDSLAFRAFLGCVTTCSQPYLYVTIYAAQVRESDKKSKVWLSNMFELQEFLISFLILLLVEEQLWFILGWEDCGEVNLLLNPQ